MTFSKVTSYENLKYFASFGTLKCFGFDISQVILLTLTILIASFKKIYCLRFALIGGV